MVEMLEEKSAARIVSESDSHSDASEIGNAVDAQGILLHSKLFLLV